MNLLLNVDQKLCVAQPLILNETVLQTVLFECALKHISLTPSVVPVVVIPDSTLRTEIHSAFCA